MEMSLAIYAQELYHQMLAQDSELKALHERFNSLKLLEAISLKKALTSTVNHYYSLLNVPEDRLDQETVGFLKQLARQHVHDAIKYFSNKYGTELRSQQSNADAMNSRFAFRRREEF
jgi:hypothetical protein